MTTPSGPIGFRCHHLHKVYAGRNGSVRALEDVTFSVGEHEFVCIVGPSGCGKTTLLKIIAGLLEPSSGHIAVTVGPANDRHQRALVFQTHGLFPWMTVLDNAAFGLEMRGVERRESRERAKALIEQLGLGAFCENYPHELSAGMGQRVGIIRAFLTDPQILLMDEPFGSLDAQTKLVLQDELLRMWKSNPRMVIYVTHDIEEAILLGDRVLVMTGRPGRIRAQIPVPLGRPRDLSTRDAPVIAEVKCQIWNMLKEEVCQSLRVLS